MGLSERSLVAAAVFPKASSLVWLSVCLTFLNKPIIASWEYYELELVCVPLWLCFLFPEVWNDRMTQYQACLGSEHALAPTLQALVTQAESLIKNIADVGCISSANGGELSGFLKALVTDLPSLRDRLRSGATKLLEKHVLSIVRSAHKDMAGGTGSKDGAALLAECLPALKVMEDGQEVHPGPSARRVVSGPEQKC